MHHRLSAVAIHSTSDETGYHYADSAVGGCWCRCKESVTRHYNPKTSKNLRTIGSKWQNIQSYFLSRRREISFPADMPSHGKAKRADSKNSTQNSSSQSFPFHSFIPPCRCLITMPPSIRLRSRGVPTSYTY
jgi:hypothetical protein